MASRRAWTVAWSSHQRASGDAAWMAPNADPHRTGTRTHWPARGAGAGAGMGVMAGAAWRLRGGTLRRWTRRWRGRQRRWAAMAGVLAGAGGGGWGAMGMGFRLAGGEPWGIRCSWRWSGRWPYRRVLRGRVAADGS